MNSTIAYSIISGISGLVIGAYAGAVFVRYCVLKYIKEHPDYLEDDNETEEF